jgi:uncharacterized damage-inducible protein DinB
MHADATPLDAFYQGWGDYQGRLVRAVAPLSPAQLTSRATPTLRPVWELAAHIVAARAVWFHLTLGEGDPALAPFARWDVAGASPRTAAELADGLAATWQLLGACLGRWTAAMLGDPFTTRRGRPITRGLVLWHVLEHDLHHGGELSLTLGTQGLPGLDL